MNGIQQVSMTVFRSENEPSGYIHSRIDWLSTTRVTLSVFWRPKSFCCSCTQW